MSSHVRPFDTIYITQYFYYARVSLEPIWLSAASEASTRGSLLPTEQTCPGLQYGPIAPYCNSAPPKLTHPYSGILSPSFSSPPFSSSGILSPSFTSPPSSSSGILSPSFPHLPPPPQSSYPLASPHLPPPPQSSYPLVSPHLPPPPQSSYPLASPHLPPHPQFWW